VVFETGLFCKHCTYTETSSLRTKILPRNLNEIVHEFGLSMPKGVLPIPGIVVLERPLAVA
jgi:hypothetical protein